jgi:hypothetical protein
VFVLEDPQGNRYGETISRGHRFLLEQGFHRSDAERQRSIGIKTPSFDSEFFFTVINYRQLGLQVLVIGLITAVTLIIATFVLKNRSTRNA